MPAYLISLEPESGYRDLDAIQRYAEAVPAIVADFDGRYLAPHVQPEILEGDWKPDFVVLIEFPSMTRLREFYDSAAYRPWLELRQKAGDGRIVALEGR
jgi:uncharacterized protein (DUF1330 family)